LTSIQSLVFCSCSSLELPPFLYEALEKERLTSDNYGSIGKQTIEQLESKGVKVRSIVGNNLPAQVSALAH
jgi:hypothetical protein